MSTGMKMRADKIKKTMTREAEAPAVVPEPIAETAPPTHVVGKPAEVEPTEYAASPAEAPEAAVRSAEAPDAGYGRCTESSDWENRGRS